MQYRRIFNYDDFSETKIVSNMKNNIYENTISACGCLIYKKNKNELLLISYEDPNWPNLDDFGGKIEKKDNTVFDTIIRETVEETNGIISKKYLKKIIKSKKYTQFYNNFSKYLCIVIEVCDDFCTDTNVFGDTELHDNIKRSINWHSYQEIKSKLSHRLKNAKDLIAYLSD